jgi:fatty-acid desaturase
MKRVPEYCQKILLPLHLLGLLGFFLLNDYSLLNFITFIIFWFLFGCVGIEIGSHRLFSHSAFYCSLPMRNFLGLLSCYGGQWSPIWWASLHRGIHHPKADTIHDVHSPQNGFFHAYFGWYFTLDRSIVSFSSTRDLLKSPFQLWLHKNYVLIFWTPFLTLALFNLQLALCVFIYPALASIHQENLINSFCHSKKFGYRNYATNDLSTNNWLLGTFLWGAGFHNNHHHDPKQFNFGKRWFEFDACGYLVPAIVFIDQLLFKPNLPLNSNASTQTDL